VNIDDCYLLQSRDANSHIIVDPDKFPSGMKNLSDDLHKNGFMFGIYNSAGYYTC
jgi:alpha-galactosidase